MAPREREHEEPQLSALAFTGGVVIALLAGCGGAQSAAGLAPLGQRGGIASKQTFAYTGSEQKFKVPAGVTQVVVTVDGASGAPGYDDRYGKLWVAGRPWKSREGHDTRYASRDLGDLRWRERQRWWL